MATHVEDGTGDKLDRSMFDGMIRGQDYVYSDLFIQKMAKQEGAKVKAINKAEDEETKMRLLRDFMRIGDEVDFSWSMPLFAEYGCNLKIGTGSYVGPNAYILNVSPVTIGERVLIGPNVQLYAATHPTSPEVRNGKYGPEASKAIVIEDDCWIGGSVIVLAGVTIGRGSTVGAGSVVTKNVAPRTVVAGNPARFIKNV